MNQTTEKTSRTWWRFGRWTWLGIAVLIAVNVAYFAGWFTPDRRFFAWTINSLDPRVWPIWIAGLMWGITVWIAADIPKWPDSMIGLKQIIKPVLIMFLVGLICWIAGWHTKAIYIIYYQFYWPIIVAPWSNYMVDGSLNWKMAIPPVLALIGFVYCIRILVRIRKKRKSETESERT